MSKKKLAWWLVAAAVVVALVAAVANQIVQKQQKGKEGPKPEVALAFSAQEVVKPQTSRLPRTLEFSGPLVAPQTAIVRAKASGTLLSLSVAEGSKVKSGQWVGRVDASDFDHRLNERRAMVEAARAQSAQAERTHASNQSLAQEKFISPNALEASRAALDAARANARAAEAQLGTVRTAAQLANLVAPIDGVVLRKHVVAGEKLSPEQQVLTIVDVRQLEVAAVVAAHEVSALKVGLEVPVLIEGESKPTKGVVARIAPAAEAGTRSIPVAVALDNTAETWRAGQYAVVTATLPSDQARLTVPINALVVVGGQEYVWVIDGGVLARRSVTTGLRDAAQGRVEVVRGLAADAQVLAMKFDGLREGRAAALKP